MSNNKYVELSKRQQHEMNALPIAFAFSNKQFEEMMVGWGLDPEKDLDKIARIPAGGFVQKKDEQIITETVNRHDRELKEAIEADTDGSGFIYDMFLYELENHEYGYTGDESDTLMALGLSRKDIASDERLYHGLCMAMERIMGGQA
jgi:hypothetical protein